MKQSSCFHAQEEIDVDPVQIEAEGTLSNGKEVIGELDNCISCLSRQGPGGNAT